MQVIQGKVQALLHGPAGEIAGLILDPGVEVRISPAQSVPFLPIIGVGSNVEIHGWTRPGPSGGMQFDAEAIANIDTDQLVCLKESPFPRDPEVSLVSPRRIERAAPLVPPSDMERAEAAGLEKNPSGIEALYKEDSKRVQLAGSQPANAPENRGSRSAATVSWASREGAARSIERAYDGLHRAQAMLAYVKIVDLEDPDAGQFLDEARSSYQQALSTYQREDFTAAAELAAASSSLSSATELVVCRVFRSSASSPTLVPPPPLRQATPAESALVQNRLLRVQELLARIRWLLENGTMPLEDTEAVERIAGWGEAFLLQARQLFQRGRIEDAIEVVQAAEAVMRSAEHRCKKCYVALESDSRLLPTAQHTH